MNQPSDAGGTLQETVAQYAGKSREELFDTLKNVTEQERAAGGINNTKMDDIYEKLSPFLTDAQRERMQEVLRRLKE